MKTTRFIAASVLALAAMLSAAPAVAGGYRHGGHYHGGYYGSRFVFGVNVGWPYYGYGYGYSPYYYPYAYPAYGYYPPYAAQQPQVYVEQPQAQQSPGYWYYCADSRAYYPYVKECAAGWQRVAPQPQN